MVPQARAFYVAVPARGTCPLTGATNLKDAIAAILATPPLVARVDHIVVAPSISVTITGDIFREIASLVANPRSGASASETPRSGLHSTFTVTSFRE
jgi:hypothetical protein